MPTLDFERQTLPWSDRDDFAAELARRRASDLDERGATVLQSWHDAGFVHLPGLIEPELIDRLLDDYEDAWEKRPPVRLLVEGAGVQPFPEVAPRHELTHHHYRVMDIQDVSPAARRIILHERIIEPLRWVFSETPVAMQSLFFEYGSEQAAHQDFPYVQAEILSHLVGCWVACDDVDENNGPLFYFPGSHRLAKFDWGGGNLAFDGQDSAKVEDFEAFLIDQCTRAGLERQTFPARKGDVLLWHAALVHGGSPARDHQATRRSLVIHYSTATAYPRDRRTPHLAPRVVSENGGRLYLPPRRTGLMSRLRGAVRRLAGA